MESNKTIVGKCPLCGKDVVKTLRGYACTGNHEQPQACTFNIFSTIGNRQLTDAEVSELLAVRQIMLDGFVTKEGKAYCSILRINEQGGVDMGSLVGKCPICGGDLYVAPRSIYCSNFRSQEARCDFHIWRNIGGHQLTITEVNQILSSGRTEQPVPVYNTNGNRTERHIGMLADKQIGILNEN